MSLDPGILDQLRESLRRLASPPTEQLQALGSDEGPVDEIALEFDDVAQAVALSGWLSPEGAAAVRQLGERLSKMSGRANAHLWTRSALSQAAEWQEIRRLAQIALGLLPRSRTQ